MASRSVDIAKAIVAKINERTYPQGTVKAKRRAVPFYSVDELRGLEVSVFTGTRSAERVHRGEDGFERVYKPVVAIQKQLNAGDEDAKLAESDSLQDLVEEIEEQLQDEDLLPGLSFVGFGEEQDEDTYNIEAMKNLGTFAAIIILEYTDG